jgi:hypothetical protein
VSASGSIFIARYDGVCTVCEGLYFEGDLVGFVNNDLACGDCWDQVRTAEKAAREERRARR